MPRKRTGYDAACYYDGKLLGRCTKADSDAYTLLMNACGGDAARVLREYAYFSPELRAILEKAALMQADRSRTGGMFHAPKSSPWGEVQSCETLCPGVFLVSTASHGGTMVANEVAAVLSPAAKKCGFKDKGYICYEEDAQESVVLRELLDKKLWKIPDRIKDKGQFEEKLNQSIRQYHPEYWRARQSGREAAEAARSTAPHCSAITASAGQSVRKGDAIAKVGATGNATGAHLHFEVHDGEKYLNPVYYVVF